MIFLRFNVEIKKALQKTGNSASLCPADKPVCDTALLMNVSGPGLPFLMACWCEGLCGKAERYQLLKKGLAEKHAGGLSGLHSVTVAPQLL